MQRLEVSGEVRPIYGSLGVKRLRDEFYFNFIFPTIKTICFSAEPSPIDP